MSEEIKFSDEEMNGIKEESIWNTHVFIYDKLYERKQFFLFIRS